MNRPPSNPTRPLRLGRASVTIPLLETEIYRPGPFLALGILLLPLIAPLIVAALALRANHGIPLWLPFLLLLWIPCVPLLWLVMQSVRINTTGISVGNPWRTWRTVPWPEIANVEQRGPALRITDHESRKLTIIPILLRDGSRFRRHMLPQVPARALSKPLSIEAQHLMITASHGATPSGMSVATLTVRPQRIWHASAIGAMLAAIALALVVILTPQTMLSIGLLILAAILLIGGAYALIWLQQSATFDSSGVSVSRLLPHRMDHMAWTNLQLVEMSPSQMTIRLHGKHALVCIGPRLLAPSQRTVLRALLRERSEAPIVTRK